MSAITPDSYIKLVRFDVTKEHQITFPDGVAQVDFFKNQLNGVVLEASSYQRKDYKVRFEACVDEIERYNYMIVQNSPYNYKYFFYYITDMQYISDNMTEISIKLDVFQTYQFDFHYLKSFIEREHTNDDSVGSNTIPEGLETGNFIVNKKEELSLLRTIYIVNAKRDLDGGVVAGTQIAGIYYPGIFYACAQYKNVVELINEYGDIEHHPNVTIEDIDNIYMIPSAFIPVTIGADEWINLSFALSVSGGFQNKVTLEKTISKPLTIDDYTPINKKLLTREFNYLVVSNEVGATEDLAYENFKTSQCNFYLSASPCATGNAILTPQSYGNISTPEEYPFEYTIYALPMGKFPMISINYDYYRLWLDKNMFNITTGAIESGIESIGGALQMGIGASTGDVGGVVSGGTRSLGIYGYAYNLYKEMYNKRKIPPVTISQTSSSEIFCGSPINHMGFSFYQFCVKREYAKIIDNFFSKFGYKTLENKVPNITGRSNWNYVKTIEACVDSETIPKKYLDEFKDMLNRGITFWHNPSTFMDYSQTNSIL